MNAWTMQPVAKPFLPPRNSWLGDFQTPEGQHLGGLYKTAENEYRVWAPAPFGNGKIVAELPRVLHRGEFKIIDSFRVTATQRVRVYSAA